MIRINLIPPEERIVTTTAGPNWALISAVVAPVFYGLILASVWSYQSHKVAVLDEMIDQEEATMARYKPAVAMLSQLRQEQTEIQARLDALDEVDRYRNLPVKILEQINRAVPRYLWLEAVEETGAPGVELAIKGSTFSNLIVSDFLDRLAGSDLFTIPELSITQEKKIGDTKVVSFSLVARGVPADERVSADGGDGVKTAMLLNEAGR